MQLADPHGIKKSTVATLFTETRSRAGRPQSHAARFYQLLPVFGKNTLGARMPPTVKEFASSKAHRDAQTLDKPTRDAIPFEGLAADLGDLFPNGSGRNKLDSSDLEWLGPGSNGPSTIEWLRAEPAGVESTIFSVFERESHRSAELYICVHGHFYQQPRENPFLEV